MSKSKSSQVNSGVNELRKLTGKFHYVMKHKGFYTLRAVGETEHTTEETTYGMDDMISYINKRITEIRK